MSSAPILMLLAQAEPADAAEVSQGLTRLNQISENLSSDGLISTNGLLIAVGLILLLLSTLSIAQWWKRRHEQSHPWLVFLAAARAAGLGLRHQWSLYWIARQTGLVSPLTLMLAPGTFDAHVKAYLETRPGWRREALRRRAQELRELLFGDLGAQSYTRDVGRTAA